MTDMDTDLEGYPIPYERDIEPMDTEVVALCRAINGLSPDVKTISSCCGHGYADFSIYFAARNLDALPIVLYWIDECHTGETGWRVEAFTSCGADHVTFALRGGRGAPAYESAERLARVLALQRIVPETHEYPSVCSCPDGRDALVTLGALGYAP